jgi:hypothetical protein
VKIAELKEQIDCLGRTATVLYEQTWPRHRQTSYNVCKVPRQENMYQLTQLTEVGRSKVHVKPWPELISLLALYPGNLQDRKDWRVM